MYKPRPGQKRRAARRLHYCARAQRPAAAARRCRVEWREEGKGLRDCSTILGRLEPPQGKRGRESILSYEPQCSHPLGYSNQNACAGRPNTPQWLLCSLRTSLPHILPNCRIVSQHILFPPHLFLAWNSFMKSASACSSTARTAGHSAWSSVAGGHAHHQHPIKGCVTQIPAGAAGPPSSFLATHSKRPPTTTAAGQYHMQ